jgi:uncharacterized protein (DUF1501 family)
MKRRTFLRRTLPAVTVPLAINGLRFRALARGSALERSIALAGGSDRVLVIIQLEGGNDGLNTVVPVEDDAYYKARPALALPKENALVLDGQPLLRLHPAMTGMQRLFNGGRLAIVSNIGYDHATLSHFAGIENWNTASGGAPTERRTTGWIGRYLSEEYPDFPTTLPASPPAIQIRPSTSSIFGIPGATIGMSLTDPAEFYAMVNGGPDVADDLPPDTLAGREWKFIRSIDTQAIEYSEAIRGAAARAANRATYPAGNALAESLASIARLIAGGLETRVYMVSLGNFDTHSNQLGQHASLLGALSDGVAAFMDDLVALGVDGRVVGMTYSEFGRRVFDNGSGTDHGTAAPHFVFGTPIDGGKVFGGVPDVAGPDPFGNLKFTIPFHCYYASVLAPHFDVGEDVLARVLPYGLCDPGSRVPLYRAATVGVPDIREGVVSLSATPNPTSGGTVIGYRTGRQGYVDLALHAIDGAHVMTIASGAEPAGDHLVRADLSRLAPGVYMLRLKHDGVILTRPITVVR